MKSIFVKAACIAAIVSSPWTACSQYYYVVVGAFAGDEHASELKEYFPGKLADSSYTVSDKDNPLHLYVLKTTDKESAISKTLFLQKAMESFNAATPAAPEYRIQGSLSGTPPPAVSELKKDPVIETTAVESGAAGASASLAPNAATVPPRPAGKYFKFRIESPEGELIQGQVHHVDLAHGRELGTYASNSFVDLLSPRERSGSMTLVCGMFGYKDIFKDIDYTNPAATDNQAYVDTQGAWVIPYKLERLEKGDVSIMYNVSFYKDAAIMRKPSKADLDELVKMMKSNPYYEITIHSYCNGRNKREIIAPGASKNYFDMAGSVTVKGSAKDLTALRAESIRSYLVDAGIDAGRIRTFPWGGSDMLVRSDSPDAAINDRIEIEIMRD